MTVYEGTIITCDDNNAVVRYLVEDKGIIQYAGNDLPARYAMAKRVAAPSSGEPLVISPSFADTHIHFMSHALFSNGLDVRSCKTIPLVLDAVREWSAKRKDKIIIGFGVSQHSLAERRMLTRDDLDSVCPERPVFIVKYDGHAAVVNSSLIRILPESVKKERGYDAESGFMSQDAFFRVTDFVTGTVSLPDTLTGMLKTMDTLASAGIGLVHSVAGVGFPLDMDVTLESLFARGLRNPVTYRLFFQTMDAGKVLKRKLPRIGGCFVTALDGCFGSEDAALHKPYFNNSANTGVLYHSDETVRDFMIRANRAGLQIEVHAIGDKAFTQAVNAFEAALNDTTRTDHRHTIIHACLPTEEGLNTCARLGIALAVQPAFLDWEQEPLPYLESILGKRAYEISPLKTMQEKGLLMTGGSDGPCTIPNPIEGMHAACNHYVAHESLSPQEALNLYTRNAARLCFDEKERGSLEAGKIADFVILSGNPLTMPRGEIRSIRVRELYLSGKRYKSGQGRLSLLARALFSGRRI